MEKVETIRDKIAALLPDLERSLETDREEVVVGGLTIQREEAEKIYKEFKNELKSQRKTCHVTWDVVPLKLAVANRNWRSLQESLNQIK